ncbi:polymorphic toxin-type HINT domain-containing protein [Mangrovihabitans endophyticus]|uniref:Hint domain-containing protein n=1 Tax=Mangrovihabitans endophyticus TaxID=1751298 RepID=A0A8J3BVV5_9ACTN|nr:polymorphic toxin-type HINT domain-containing protein [Mangrovihabitans endophyticus]GGK77709.1 hypothetical protein GCM10012284_09570 [Mangrovihabitans endophyticus]
MGKSWTYRAATAALAAAITATSLVGASGAARADQADDPVDRAGVVRMWRSGGDLLAPAAEQALLGTDDDVHAFLDRAADLQTLDDRIAVNRILSAGGPTVRARAQAALDSGDLGDFLSAGWQDAAHVDERVRVNQMLSTGDAQVQAAAQAALDADASVGPTVLSDEDPDESPSGPLDTFLATGWQKPFEIDQRLAVTRILSAAPAGSNVRRLAQRALDARDVDALTSFLDTQHAIAAARDEEASTITDLVGAAERASAQADELTKTAEEEGAKAAAAASAARESAQQAQAAMESAAGNAEKAAAAAQRAAAAASKAAQAAARAMSAAQMAVSAARAAAAAASRAAATAALTRAAANRASKAAADAAVDKNKSDAAKALAENALKCAKLSRDAAYVVGRAEEVANSVISIAQSADDAGADARRAVIATQEALAQAHATGVNVAQAQAAAARARRQADRANRASVASLTFARAAVKAAGDARRAATQAADDATAAAEAANEAAAHAGDATRAAQASTAAANAASQAADDAVTAANDAYAVYEAARAVDAERLAVATEEGSEQAQADLAAYQDYQDRVDWDAQEATKRDAETNRLIAEVRNPATDPAVAVADSRRVALNLAVSGGPSTQQEALTALSSGDADVVDFVRVRVAQAAAADDRNTLATIATTGTLGLRTAALAAMDGTDAQVADFLQDQDYPERGTEERVMVTQILDEATQAGDDATADQAQRALDGSDQDRHEFVTIGQFQSANADDRIRATRMATDDDSGPELKAAAQNALDGPPGALHDFVTTGWYSAQQNDDDAATHELEMIALLQRASSAATAATQRAEEAQAVAANARGDAAAAQTWAEKAGESAQQAVAYASQADQSAQKAERSALHALDSAKSAAAAAKRANSAANKAAQSAAAARESYRQARKDANRAVDAAERAKASALAAGKNLTEALALRRQAYEEANELIEQEEHARLDALHTQFAECMRNTLPGFEAKCYEVYEPTDLRLGKATLNKEFCNKFAQTDSVYYQNCVADTFNPNFMMNRAMDILSAAAITFTQWTTFAFGSVGLAAFTAVCAALCTAVVGVLGGAEVSMGIGGLFTTWAEGSLLSYLAGGAWSGVVGGRILGELKGTLNLVRIPAVFERVTLPRETVDANFARLVSERGLPSCVTSRNSFLAGTPVLLADGTTKPIEDVVIGDRVLATDPVSGATDARSVTELIPGFGRKDLVDVTVDTDGPGGAATGTLTATANHPFWVPDLRSWVDAGDLIPGQWLRTSSGTWVRVTAVHHRVQRTGVYNFTVDTRHTYYVLAGGAALLVHNDACGVELEDLGAGWFESPNHLLYGPGSVQGHRILHVLDHAHANPDKPIHSVFDIGSRGVLDVIDEAWLLRGTNLLTKTEGNRTFYIIPMGRTIGTNGEQNILIIVRNGDEIITAYPKKSASWTPDAP